MKGQRWAVPDAKETRGRREVAGGGVLYLTT